MNGFLLLAALAAAPLAALGRAWIGPWAPDVSAAVLAFAVLGPSRLTAATAMLLLGLGRAILTLQDGLSAELLAALISAAVLGLAADGLREVFGRRPGFAGALLAAGVWSGVLAARAWVNPLAMSPGPELIFGALLMLPFAWRRERVVRRRWA